MYVNCNDKILSLNNAKVVEKITTGTGAKTNPYHYSIRISYWDANIGNSWETVSFDSAEDMEDLFAIIATKLGAI